MHAHVVTYFRNGKEMPDIDRQLFKGNEALNTADWEKLTVADWSPRNVEGALERNGWEHKAAAAVAIRLKPDNSGPEAAKLLLAGSWGDPLKVQAKRIFDGADEDTILEVELNDLAVFRFNENMMASRYTPQEAVKHRYIQGEAVLEDEEDRMQQGIGDFSLRVVAGLSKACGVKYGIWLQVTVLIYHLSAENMDDREQWPLADSPEWPGIKLAEGQIPMIPTAGKKAKLWDGRDWGAPIAPVVVPGVPWEAAPGPPDQQEVLAACAQLLNGGTAADSCANVGTMQKKWERGSVTRRPAEKSWPTPQVATASQPAKKGNSRLKTYLDATNSGGEY